MLSLDRQYNKYTLHEALWDRSERGGGRKGKEKGKAGGVALVAEGLLSMLEGQSSKPRPS